MSKYTTGEIAKICDVTVRTIQFYDTKQILIPSELTAGGRRLYSDLDLERLKLICLLKSLGLSLDAIKEILKSENQTKILKTLLIEQSKQISLELSKKQKQLSTIDLIIENITAKVSLPLTLITDIDHIMKEKSNLKKTYQKLGIIITISTLILLSLSLLSIIYKLFWPFLIGAALHLILCSFMMREYYKDVAYICSHCNEKFKPKPSNFFFSKHTAKTRKLTCSHCGKKEYCIETSDK